MGTGSGSSFGGAFQGARVLVTGHTGFKGAWLCEWLLQLGADVHGLALPPETEPNLFTELGLATRLRHRLLDLREPAAVCDAVAEIRPDFVLHLAAQAVVRLSYQDPIATYASNVMGTAHLLEAVRLAGQTCAIVCITTDKCYENREWVHAYRESDPLGGHDPYSSSKAAAELIIAAYRKSYFSRPDSPVRLASARAGNVIGGGDWTVDRIVPDAMRAFRSGQSLGVRNVRSTRPWQHVLEPLAGYLWLAARLHQEAGLAEAFNFGPPLESNRTVRELVEAILSLRPGAWHDASDPAAPHEASLLNLAHDKAYHRLGWRPVWDFARTVAATVEGYEGTAPAAQIAAYTADARRAGVAWAAG